MIIKTVFNYFNITPVNAAFFLQGWNEPFVIFLNVFFLQIEILIDIFVEIQ